MGHVLPSVSFPDPRALRFVTTTQFDHVILATTQSRLWQNDSVLISCSFRNAPQLVEFSELERRHSTVALAGTGARLVSAQSGRCDFSWGGGISEGRLK